MNYLIDYVEYPKNLQAVIGSGVRVRQASLLDFFLENHDEMQRAADQGGVPRLGAGHKASLNQALEWPGRNVAQSASSYGLARDWSAWRGRVVEAIEVAIRYWFNEPHWEFRERVFKLAGGTNSIRGRGKQVDADLDALLDLVGCLLLESGTPFATGENARLVRILDISARAAGALLLEVPRPAGAALPVLRWQSERSVSRRYLQKIQREKAAIGLAQYEACERLMRVFASALKAEKGPTD